MINLNAPIIPWEGLGEIKLYSSISDLKDVIETEEATSLLYDRFQVRYEIKDKLYLFFSLLNSKLFKITALGNYKGKLPSGICIGQNIAEALLLDNSLEYDDFEEVYVSSNGVFLETDAETDRIQNISIFINELETESFKTAEW